MILITVARTVALLINLIMSSFCSISNLQFLCGSSVNNVIKHFEMQNSAARGLSQNNHRKLEFDDAVK